MFPILTSKIIPDLFTVIITAVAKEQVTWFFLLWRFCHIKYVYILCLAPNNELVPAKIVQQPDGDYKVEYSSKYTGKSLILGILL